MPQVPVDELGAAVNHRHVNSSAARSSGLFFRCQQQALASAPPLQQRRHGEHAEVQLVTMAFEMHATDQVIVFIRAFQNHGTSHSDHCSEPLLVNADAIEQIGFRGPTHARSIAAVSTVHQRIQLRHIVQRSVSDHEVKV